jgi:uncharacterized protein YceK
MHNSRCQVFFTNNHIRYYETPVNALILLRIGGSNVDGFCASVVDENTQPTADAVRHSTANDCEQRNTNKGKALPLLYVDLPFTICCPSLYHMLAFVTGQLCNPTI